MRQFSTPPEAHITSNESDHMAIRDIERKHLDAAISEFDTTDRKAMLDTYGFGVSTGYLVHLNGRFYDPKALIGVAHKYATGRPLTASDFVTDNARAQLKALRVPVVKFKGLWWVNQGANYATERDGGYVWAGQRAKNGRVVPSWSNVMKLQEGQLVLHYTNKQITAVGTVHGHPREATDPESNLFEQYAPAGYLCPIDYRELANPISASEFPEELLATAPFDKNGKVNQGYLYPIGDDHILDVLAFLDARIPGLLEGTFTHRTHYEDQHSDEFAGSYESDPILESLLQFKNIVLEGVPGTGKSYAIENIARQWRSRTGRSLHDFDGRPYRTTVMHPSTSYEDFIEGLRPVPSVRVDAPGYFDEAPARDTSFAVADGFFVEVCRAAVRAPHEDVLVLLDELNRCNIPSVFGDLLLTLESSRRARLRSAGPSSGSAEDWSATTTARLPYSGRTFFVPDNVYVVATTNTTDRSVAPLDAALRRRFAFHRLEPELGEVTAPSILSSADRELFRSGARILENVNEHALRPCLGPDALLGHSYFYSIADALNDRSRNPADVIASYWRYTILPQLIDSVRALNADDILDSHTRPAWFDTHSEIEKKALDRAMDALGALDDYLAQLGLMLVVEGTGLARGARIAGIEVGDPGSDDELVLDDFDAAAGMDS